ncbi:hypothetical protein Tco_0606516 [Tanacetum coccineum]
MEETDTLLSHFNDSSPDYETFCFDIEEKSSGSTTFHSYHSLSEYESFCFDVDHIEEKSSGSTTSHSDLSLLEYESFHFDISIDQLPQADRSDFIIRSSPMNSLTSYLHRNFLFLTDPSEIETFLSFPSRNEDKVFDPEILLNNGIFSFTRKSPHLLIDNFMIDNCHFLSEISFKIVSSINFHPKGKEIRGESS